MRVRSRLLTLSAVALLGVLSGCGTSGGASGGTSSSAASATPQSSTPSSTTTTATPTTTTPSPTATASPKPPAKKAVSNPPAAKAALIAIKNFTFTVPPSVSAGSKVLVVNKDGENHSVTSAVPGAFDVTAEAGGKAISFTAPTKPGSYPFVCQFHANMKGTLVVK